MTPSTDSPFDTPDGSVNGTLGILGSSNAANTLTLTMDKAGVDPAQPIGFTIVSGNGSKDAGQNVFVTALANLTPTGAGDLQYMIPATMEVLGEV